MALIKKLLNKIPQIGNECYLSETCVIIGDVIMGNNCSVWFNAVIRGDVNQIRIGNKVNIQDNVTIHCSFQKCATYIGNQVSIGHNAIVHGCTIKDKVLIGMGAIVMDQVEIESHSIIAAGAVVTQGSKIKSGELWAGIPAKKIGEVSENLKNMEIERIAENYLLYSSWYKTNENE